MKKIITLIFALIILSHNQVNAQVTYLVKDISSITLPSSPKKFVKSGSLLFFTADDALHGRELWRTDGTPAGTFMIKDMNPGVAAGMEIGTNEDYYTDVNGTLFFIAKDSTQKKQLWKTDGTASGTIKLSNIAAGITYSSPIVASNGVLFFFGAFKELWKSDGTPGGTVMVKDQLATAGVSPTKALTAVSGLVFFIGHSASTGYELWKSDGTNSGTVLVKDITPGTIGGMQNVGLPDAGFLNANGTLYFYANDGINGTELWRTNGADSTTSMVKDIHPAGSSNPSKMTLFNNEIFFNAYEPTTGYELWKTNGSDTSTVMVKNINPNGTNGSYPSNFIVKNNTLYFSASDLSANNSQLWKSDGTDTGTTLILQGCRTIYTGIQEFTSMNNEIYVSFVDTLQQSAIWKEDTLTGNFSLFKDINIAVTDNIYQMTSYNGNLIFTATDSIFQNEIWISDGTAGGTQLLKDINQDGDSYLDQFADVNGTLFFSGRDNSHGGELWKSNGNSTGTKMLVDANPNGNSNPYWTINYHNTLYCRGHNGRLWRSDGTTPGTFMVTDSAVNVASTKIYEDKLYFVSSNGLWESDGTFSGTYRVSTLVNISDYARFNTHMVYTAGAGIWHLDLSSHAVNLLLTTSPNPVKLFTFKQKLYYTVGSTLYTFDGINNTIIDTISINSTLIIDSTLYMSAYKNGISGLYQMQPSSDSVSLLKQTYSSPASLTNSGSLLYFTADDGASGNEVWVSDGTTAGTVIVKDINPSGSSSPSSLVGKYGKVYFSANDGVNGTELWVSDGTATGTQLLQNINPTGSSNPQKLTVSGDYIYFVANDGVVGKELWAYGINTTSTCFTHYSTTYDTLQNTFFLDIDPITESAAISYHWDFGDGFTSTLDSLSHTYSVDSVYNVCLRVYTSASDSCLYCHQIGVDTSGNIVRNSGFTVVVWDGPSPVGIAEINKEANALLVAPNPSEGEFKVFLDNTKGTSIIRITNITGQLIMEQNNVSGENCIINLRNQSSGIYFMEIENNGKRSRGKLIKQ